MKKILTLFLLLVFTIEPAAFAAAAADYSSASATRVKSIQSNEEPVNIDAFNNNYQESVEQTTPTVELSPVEQLFNDKETTASGNALLQVGYDLFTAGNVGAGTTGKFDNSYKLNIGEKVNVYSYGDSVDVMALSGASLVSPSSTVEVDSKGNIFIPGIGLIKAENRALSDVEVEANRLAAQKYKNMKLRLTVAAGQEFSVFVYGQVNKPGKILVGNNSSVLDALNAAGGVKKTGTLRNISYTSNSKTKNIDLYKALFEGNDDGVILRPNDKIFVDKIGDVVALRNGVTVPGIYEIKQGENIDNVVKFAGGLLPTTQQTEITLTGYNTATQERTAENVQWDKARKKTLNSGDTIQFRELYNTAENIVILQGNVKHPATYAYKEGMRLSDILKSEDELLEETFINQAVIRRISGKDNTIETIPIFLSEFFAGMNDPVLQPRDIINIYKNTNSLFVDVYGCINTPKHLTYTQNMTLNDVMADIQFIESDVTNLADNTTDKENNETEVSYKGAVEENNVQLKSSTSNSNKLIPTEQVAVEITNAQNVTQVYYLYDIMINSDRIKSIVINPDDKIFFRTLRGNEVMKTVKISGFVKTPGVYTFVEGKRLIDVINLAGGLTKEADLRGIVFKRTNLQGKQVELAHKNNERDIKLIEGRMASAYKPSEGDQKSKMDMLTMLKADDQTLTDKYNGQIALNIKNNDLDKIKDLDNIELQDGDDIYIPRLSNHVSVIGEVYNEQSFVYKKGANAKYYIKEVGGYTPNANKFRLYKVSVNGRAEKIGNGSSIEPGDTIVVPRRIAGNDWITPVCDTLKGIASIIVMAFAINKW